MAVYQKLNLGAEGGIIDVADQATQANCAVLCIGLGGTGCDCLRNLKTKVYNRLRPDNSTEDNPNPIIPEYSHIKYLAVDTDRKAFSRDNEKYADFSKLNNQEFFDISSSTDIMAFLDKNKSYIERDTTLNNWFRNGEVRIDGTDGAGQVRQIGRYLLIRSASTLVEKIKSLLREAMKDLKEPKIYIHIFSGISGGTGAGTFLDVCYLSREAISQMGVSADLLGYFFLPDVNISKGLPAAVVANVQENGYASLSELDYCMNFVNNGGCWKQEYPGLGVISNVARPVDLCHLISAMDKDGNVVSDGYEYAMNVVTEYFMDFVVQATESHTLSSHITNFGEIKKQIEKNSGATYEYSVIGAATATIPFKQVLTYLASGVFENMRNLISNLPSENNVDQFMKQNQLEFNDIMRKLTEGCVRSFSAPDYRERDVRGNTKLVIDYFEEQYAQYKNKLLTNFEGLSRGLDENYVVNEANKDGAKSLVYFINSKLQDLAADPEHGPFYAAALLQTTGTDLFAKVAGLKAAAEERYNNAVFNRDREGGYYKVYEKADDVFLNKPNRRSFGDYLNSVVNLYKSNSEIDMYDHMIKLMKILDEQLRDLSSKFMYPFRDVVNDLYDTFKENAKYIDGIVTGSIVSHSYEIPIATIPDMKPQMDKTLSDMNVKQKFSELIKSLLTKEGIAACTSGDENTVCVVVNRFFTALFHDYSQMTITKYLEQKFKVTNTVQLIDKIYTEIMEKLYERANPMYWVSATYQIDTASPLGYVTYPQTSSEIKEASERLSKSCREGEIAPRSSNVVDRISIMRCLVGVPMFGYQGVSQFENKSVASARVGKHLYEGKKYTDRNGIEQIGEDWRYLPSPTPLSLMNNTSCPILREKADKAAALYMKAVDMGVIFSPENDPNNYFIRTVTTDYIERFKNVRDRNIKKSKVDRINAVKELEDLKNNKEYNPEMSSINNESTALLGAALKQDIRIDHFVKSPIIQKKVEDEVNRLESIDAFIDELRPKEDNDLSTVQLGLLTGVLKYTYESKTIVYVNGYNQDVLSDPSMGNIARVVPSFQALLSFREFDDVTKADIKAEADKLMGTYPIQDSVKEACAVLQKEMGNDAQIIKAAVTLFPEKVDELKEFLAATKEFVEVQSLVIMMG